MEADDVVHICIWSSQPDIWIACGRWTTPAWWKPRPKLPRDIYWDDDRKKYTFEKELGNCEACKKAIIEGKGYPPGMR